MPYIPPTIKKKKLPGIRFYFPAQVAYELAVAEHKRIRRKSESIIDCHDHFLYVWEIILSVVTDPTKSMKLPDAEMVDKYRDLLFKGASRENPVFLGNGEIPGLRALLPIDFDSPITVNEQSAREMKRMYEVDKQGRVKPVRFLRNSTWEEWKEQCVDQLITLTMQIRTFLQHQLLNDQNIQQQDFEYIQDEGTGYEQE